ncbi:multiheme c-type cytochrome [Thalassoglobus polymorphus]|nr:multiheme c-type cytochrome [Thalassoglobus polymorphus]
MHSFSKQLLFLSTMLLLSGCPQAGDDSEGVQTEPAEKQLKLVASGDTQGWIMPCGCTSNQSGGLLRRGSYLKNLRKQNDVIFVDVGGAADGTAPYQLEKFRSVLKGEQLMGIHAHNLGAAEIKFGKEILDSLSESLQVPFVSANVLDFQGELIFPAYRLYQGDEGTVLVTGVVSPRYSGLKLMVSDPADAIFKMLETVSEKYDWLIVLAYLDEGELRGLATTLPEAHAVIGGPTQQSLSPQMIGPVLVTSATNKGKFLAELDFQSGSKRSLNAKVVEMSPDFADESSQEKNLEVFRGILAKKDFHANESGLLSNERWPITHSDQVAGTQTCRECHTETCDHWDQTGHAHAWERLVAEGAHVDSYCQQCHTTGYGWEGGFVSAKLSTKRVNVGCESCHGPSREHSMNSSRPTTFDAQAQCLRCHDPENSPKFQYDSYWEKIAHE